MSRDTSRGLKPVASRRYPQLREQDLGGLVPTPYLRRAGTMRLSERQKIGYNKKSLFVE